MKTTVVKNIAMTTTLAGTFLSLPSLVYAHFGKELLYKGQHSQHVKNLQTVLKTEGYYKLSKPTGYFGTSTEKAVKSFQKDHGLKVDGLVGPNTKAALNKYLPYDGTLLSSGSQGKEVKQVQESLKNMGYYNGKLDGIYGPKTRLAVLSFQKRNHLSMDGIVGPNTYKALHQDSEKTVSSSHSAPPKKVKPVETTKVAQKTVKKTSRSLASATKQIYVSATAYTAFCTGCSGTTATGIDLRAHPDSKVVAVDPSVIPLGTKLYVQGYGYAVAGDTGGAIKGKHIDLFMANRNDALQWGRRTVKVTILGK